MTNLTVISPIEINTIENAINAIEKIRIDINCENQDNRNKEDLIESILNIEDVLATVSKKLESVIEVKLYTIKQVFYGGGGNKTKVI